MCITINIQYQNNQELEAIINILKQYSIEYEYVVFSDEKIVRAIETLYAIENYDDISRVELAKEIKNRIEAKINAMRYKQKQKQKYKYSYGYKNKQKITY